VDPTGHMTVKEAWNSGIRGVVKELSNWFCKNSLKANFSGALIIKENG
jgi:hypothetical protein